MAVPRRLGEGWVRRHIAAERNVVRRLIRIFAATILVALALPVIVTALYAVVDPPALPVVRRHVAGQPVEQNWVALSAVAPMLVRGVIMAEDARFCLHYGVDLNQVRVVIEDGLAGRPVRGASTITMQTVKNLFLWPDRSYLRKAIEVPLSVLFDLILSKDRILEIYLNVAQWGPDQFGVETAAQHFFGRSAANLSEREALALATMLPAPATRDPRRPGSRQRGVIAHVKRELARAPWVFSCLPSPIRP